MEQNNNEKKVEGKKTNILPLVVLLGTGGIIFLASCFLVLLIIGGVLLFKGFQKNSADLTVVTEATLREILDISELSTVNYTYNAIATMYADDGTTVKYRVAYEGNVKAGIDFDDIKFEIDEEQKKITIILPEIEIQNVFVNIGTMEYIFTKNKYETENISQEAYKLCKADLEKRVQQEDKLFKSAKENAKSSVEALFKPWLESIEEKYEIEVR